MPFPYIRESVQAAVLSATSNILAQGISAYRNDRAFALDTTPIIRFVTYAILNTPLNCAWQEWLESNFPGSTKPSVDHVHPVGSSTPKKPSNVDEEKPPTARADRSSTKSNRIKNTLIKFGLDQTIGAAYNTIAFVAGMAALKGQNWDGILSAIQTESLHIYTAGIKLWPAVSLISFSLVPVEKRVIIGSLVGVAWGIFLSLQAAK